VVLRTCQLRNTRQRSLVDQVKSLGFVSQCQNGGVGRRRRRRRRRKRTCSFGTCVLPEMRECRGLLERASCVRGGRGLSDPFPSRAFLRYCMDECVMVVVVVVVVA